MRRLIFYFLQGLIFLVPIAITVWVFVAIFTTVDAWLGFPIPGAGFVAMIALTLVVGFLASNFLTRRLMALFESLLDRLPFIRLLHTSVKDLMGAFVGEKRRFDKPVVVDLAAGGMVKAFGFITRQSMEQCNLPDSVAVYFPQAYNFAGQVVVVPKSSVTPLNIDSSDVMAFIVSGGVTGM